MKTPLWTIVLIVLCTALTSVGQYFIKQGADRIQDFISILNLPLMIGFVFYGIGAILMIIALKYGELSVLYPIISLGFIWVALLGVYLLNEEIIFIHWIGIISIIGGVIFIGIGGKNG